jgi:hypothetical protein
MAANSSYVIRFFISTTFSEPVKPVYLFLSHLFILDGG